MRGEAFTMKGKPREALFRSKIQTIPFQRFLLPILSALFGVLFALPGQAQQSSPQRPAAVGTNSAQDLAQDTLNPFADAIKLPFQITAGFGVGPRRRAGIGLNLQPLVPLALNSDWVLIARPSFSAAYAPYPIGKFGFQDLQASFFLTPAKGTTWLWGVGPIFQFPTATNKDLGTGRWSAGPTAALIYEHGPYLAGILTYELMSFAGPRSRGSVNQTYLEPQVSYSFESGWYCQYDPSITYDWTASTSNAWSIPVGADIGKAFQMGEQAMSLQLGGYDYILHPDGASQWILRLQLTLLFPKS